MTTTADLLDDAAGLDTADPQGMLRAVASSAAQVREAAALTAEAGVARLGGEDLPRSVVVLGMGGSAIAGDVLSAVAGPECPVPMVGVRGHHLPVWVGAADLVVAVSCSGSTEETLAALEEAVRRGCRLLVVGAAGSPLHDLASRGRGVFVPVTQGRQPRASVFALATPLVIAADALGLLSCSPEEVEATAVLLEQLAGRHRPDAEASLNPAKTLALALAGQLPVVWGASPLTAVAAYRFACQLNENAKTPAVWGALPEAGHNQVVAFDGPFSAGQDLDLFRDRTEDDDGGTRMHLVLLRDTEEHPRVARRADVVTDLARSRGLDVSSLLAEGSSPFQRIASLVHLADWATTYLALAAGIDPTPVQPIDELKDALRR
ncbi:MAG TPA: bifunctional phosphoglucose/phosphomannose isomerase [Mycobacteriales bacterium]|nr:bifunctional phosphoglucose/phosphomannose isomerase [Mycobacteriales bacterium]